MVQNHVTSVLAFLGAFSVSAHILASSSQGLFHRAISQSGSVTGMFSIPPIPPNMAADMIIEAAGELSREGTTSPGLNQIQSSANYCMEF